MALRGARLVSDASCRIPRTGPGALEPVDAEASAIDNVSRWANDEDEDEPAGSAGAAQEKKS